MKRSLIRAAFVLALAMPAAAEVSVDHLPGGGVALFFEASAEGPWKRVRPGVPSTDLLNAQGDSRGDTWPQIVINPATGRPDVAWATTGDESEIQVVTHDGTAWRAPLDVSNRPGADTNPVMADDAWGNRFVAWNNARGSRLAVVLAGVDAGFTDHSQARELSSRQRDVRRPSIGVYDDGDVYVAYEEVLNGDTLPSIAIDRGIPNRDGAGQLHCSGENSIDLSRSTTIRSCLSHREMSTDVKVNVEAGELWVTWVDSSTRVGWVRLQAPGVFTPAQYRTYDPTVGDQPVRDDIRSQILTP